MEDFFLRKQWLTYNNRHYKIITNLYSLLFITYFCDFFSRLWDILVPECRFFSASQLCFYRTSSNHPSHYSVDFSCTVHVLITWEGCESCLRESREVSVPVRKEKVIRQFKVYSKSKKKITFLKCPKSTRHIYSITSIKLN